MSFAALHAYELSLHQALQTIRTPFLDQCMHILRFFDTIPFYLLLVGIVWYGYQKKCGARLLVLLVLDITINSALKTFFEQPRPFMLQPEIGIEHARFFGFPSGAAQLLLSLFGVLILTVRKSFFTIFSALFVFLVCFSRVYLGLHFPSDIVGGWLSGLILLTAFWKSLPLADHLLAQQSKLMLSSITLFATLLLAGFSIRAPFETKTFLLLLPGTGIGLIWGEELPPPTTFMERAKRALLASAGILLILFLINHTPLYTGASFFLVGAWLSFGVPLVCHWRSMHTHSN